MSDVPIPEKHFDHPQKLSFSVDTSSSTTRPLPLLSKSLDASNSEDVLLLRRGRDLTKSGLARFTYQRELLNSKHDLTIAVAKPTNSLEQTFNVINGNATAQVHDTSDLRAAFLYYCSSNVKPSEMHLAMEGPFMTAQQFSEMARDIKLVEPTGPLPMLMLGMTYAMSKEDEDDGLSYPSFLDSLLELAFECGRNVASDLQVAAESRKLHEASQFNRDSSCIQRQLSRSSAGGQTRVSMSVVASLTESCFGPEPNTLLLELGNLATEHSEPVLSRSEQSAPVMARPLGQPARRGHVSESGAALMPPHLPRPKITGRRLRFSDSGAGLSTTLLAQECDALALPAGGPAVRRPSPGLQRLETMSRMQQKIARAKTCALGTVPSGQETPLSTGSLAPDSRQCRDQVEAGQSSSDDVGLSRELPSTKFGAEERAQDSGLVHLALRRTQHDGVTDLYLRPTVHRSQSQREPYVAAPHPPHSIGHPGGPKGCGEVPHGKPGPVVARFSCNFSSYRAQADWHPAPQVSPFELEQPLLDSNEEVGPPVKRPGLGRLTGYMDDADEEEEALRTRLAEAAPAPAPTQVVAVAPAPASEQVAARPPALVSLVSKKSRRLAKGPGWRL